jgi:HNH endonuclease
MHDQIACSRGCGLVSTPGPIGRHERSCWTPATITRLYEIGSVDVSVDGCWEWHSIDGGSYDWYPRIGQRKVSQVVCLLVYGKALPGQRPLHACDNMRCIRPDHLRWGDQSENVQDTYDHGRRKLRVYPDFCPSGHKFTPENTRIRKRGKYKTRVCRRCEQIYNRERRLKQKR